MAVAHRELDAEIDAKTDKKRDEGNGDDVEDTHHRKADRHGEGEAGKDRDQDRGDDAEGLQRQPQHQQHAHQHGDAHQAGPFGQGAELLVRHRHIAGQAHRDAMGGIEPQRPRIGANGVAGLFARLQGVEVQHRLDGDEAAKLFRPRRCAGKHRAPGKISDLAARRILEHRRQLAHRGVDVGQARVAAADAEKHRIEAVHQPAQRRVGGQGSQEGLRLDQLRRGVLYFFFGEEKQPVAVEEIAAIGPAHAAEQAGPGLELFA